MKLQLWSYNYAPEPLGIGPVSRAWALAMSDRGHEVEVIAAHPHYPEPRWGRKALPYREVRDGIAVTRLPLIAGRSSVAQRMIQELSFVASQSLAIPALGTPDVVVAVSPSFPALLPTMVNSALRRVPWALWLKDLLPEGAAATGYMTEGTPLFNVARRFELAAYRSARRIFVLSETFRENLLSKGVPAIKVTRVYDPATQGLGPEPTPGGRANRGAAPRILCMGNIGRSQNLPAIVRAFEADRELEAVGVRLVLTGTGVAEAEVRAAIGSERVEMKGLLSDAELRDQLRRASLGAVTQHNTRAFNVPSKVMNYLGWGLPVVASVRPEGEIAKLLQMSGGGWVTSSADPLEFPRAIREALSDQDELDRRARSGWEFAQENFTPAALAKAFEQELEGMLR
jgi:putative colanic acid biosynthesis glycosyltransferase WcaI